MYIKCFRSVPFRPDHVLFGCFWGMSAKQSVRVGHIDVYNVVSDVAIILRYVNCVGFCGHIVIYHIYWMLL